MRMVRRKYEDTNYSNKHTWDLNCMGFGVCSRWKQAYTPLLVLIEYHMSPNVTRQTGATKMELFWTGRSKRMVYGSTEFLECFFSKEL